MQQDSIYLDNSATTRVDPEVAELVLDVMTGKYGNPSALYRPGLEAERLVTRARSQVAETLAVASKEIFFTSGGTESNNLALKGAARALRRRGRTLITSKIEHPSVLNALAQLEDEGFRLLQAGVDASGRVNPQTIVDMLSDDVILVSLMMANNEVGTVQPVAQIGTLLKDRPHCVFHVDGVQAFGKLQVRPKELGVDLLTISGHKLHAPKGIGALYVRDGVHLQPLFGGGGQEKDLRPGTENVPGIAGLGMAATKAVRNLLPDAERMRSLRDRLAQEVLTGCDGARRNGSDTETTPHILNVSFPGVKGEVLLHTLETKGIYISTGSACSSHKRGQSHVLTAMGIPEAAVEGSIRISLSTYTTEDDVKRAAEAIVESVAELRMLTQRRGEGEKSRV